MAKKKGVIRGFFGSVFDFRRGTSFDQVLTYGKLIKLVIKDLFKPPKSKFEKAETFEETAKRLNLSEKTIQKRAKNFLYLSLSYLIFGLSLFSYFLYLLINSKSLLAILMCLILALVMFSYAFRESFLYMQMRKRKTGCSFKEWVKFIVGKT